MSVNVDLLEIWYNRCERHETKIDGAEESGIGEKTYMYKICIVGVLSYIVELFWVGQ